MPTLSSITITKNEERHLARALESVEGLADEIIVVDSESTDRTVETAQQFTDNVFVRPWAGYGPQKNFAREQASGEWLLHIDADEELSPELAEEIHTAIQSTEADFLWLRLVTEFLGRPLRHMLGTNLRLFRRGAGRWDDRKVHEQVERLRDHSTVRLHDPDTRLLTTPLIHHSHYQTLAGYRERQERYSSADAEQMLTTRRDRQGRTISVDPHNPFSTAGFIGSHAITQFLRKFLRQRGFLDGWQGWLWSYLSTEYEVKMCTKYLRLLQEQKPR